LLLVSPKVWISLDLSQLTQEVRKTLFKNGRNWAYEIIFISYSQNYKTSLPITSANVGYARHYADVTCSGCSTSCTGKMIKNGPVFFKEEKICYKIVYYTLYLSYANRQKSCFKNRVTKLEFTQTKNGLF